MRSLTLKLTLAFVLVGMAGAILVALLVGVRTRSEFDRFLAERDQPALVSALAGFYAAHGRWDGVGASLAHTPTLESYSQRSVIVDPSGRVVLGNSGYPAGQTVPASALDGGTPIQVGGQTIGVLLANLPSEQANPSASRSPDRGFLDRVGWAAAVSAGVAAAFALLLGTLLARTLTRPLRELTAATQAMARGALDQRVAVRSRDEVGELAASFNHMSADLARASQLRTQMTADLAHDLRTPLSILRGYTEGLQDGRLAGAPKLYTIMHGEVEHLQRLVEDLRVLSLADAGELPLNRRAVDPAALLERAGLAYIVQAEQQGVELRVEAPAALPSVLVDTDRLTQVLNNLVSNALRYTGKGGTIALRASSELVQANDRVETQNSRSKTQHSVVFSVRDTGSGIDPVDMPFVFERFYRADKARQRGGSDLSGLGLAISRAIVEAHGGTIAVDSAAGHGTTFTIALPSAPSLACTHSDLSCPQALAGAQPVG